MFSCNYIKNNDINYNKNENLFPERNSLTSEKSNNFIGFEQDVICKEFKKIFIAISYTLDKSKQKTDENIIEDDNKEEEKKEEIIINNNDKNNEFDFDNFYTINKKEILKDLDLDINDDLFVLDQEEINIEVREYSPKFFQKIRKSDNLNEDKLIKFFLPKNVTPDLFKKTNDSNYYINSTNKQFLLKSINIEEINFFKNKLINGHIDEYLDRNKNSIINRVYGLYYIKMDNEKHYYIALLENIYESIDNQFLPNRVSRISESFEILDQKENLKELENIEKIMKIDENEIETKILKNEEKNGEKNLTNTLNKSNTFFNSEKKFIIDLDENEYDRLIKIIDKDIKFLHNSGIKRVKFFVVEKIVNNNMIENLFNKKDDNQENKKEKSNEENISLDARKYIFKSAKNNIIYSIAVLGYFYNIQE